MSIIEVVLVTAILAILVGIGSASWVARSRSTAAQGAVSTFQQSVWQGATAAASRGIVVELVRQGNELQLLDVNNGSAVIRRYELPNGVSISVANPILTFLPPGKVEVTSLDAVSGGFELSTGEYTYNMEISLIGEVKAERVGGP